MNRLESGNWIRHVTNVNGSGATGGIGNKDSSSGSRDQTGIYPEASFVGGTSEIRRIAMRFTGLVPNPSRVELFLKWNNAENDASEARVCSPTFESNLSDGINSGHIFAACADSPGGNGDSRQLLVDRGVDWWSVELPTYGNATTCEVGLVFEHDIDGTPHIASDETRFEDHTPVATAPYLLVTPHRRYRLNGNALLRRREYYSGYTL